MSKDNFIKNSLILSLSTSTMGVLRFVFSIILSKELGAEGMGLYSLVMPIFDLFCCAVCGGFIAAISKEGAVLFERKDYSSLNNTIKTVMKFDFFWSCFVAIMLFFLAPFISTYIIRDPRALNAIRVISPALVFIAMSSIIKGYFYAISKVTVPAIIDIVEKAIRISIVIGLIGLLPEKNILNTVTLVYIALSIGELVSFLLLYGYFKFYKTKFPLTNTPYERKSQLLFNVLVVSVPLCINGFLSTALSTVSTLIIPLRLVTLGYTHSEALSMIGRFTGMALSITLFPIMIVSSMCIMLIPDVSQSLSKKDYYGLGTRIESVIRFSILIGVATLILCQIIPNELGHLFYKRADLGNYIKFSSISAPFVYASVTTFSILSGLGKQKELLKISLLTSVEELVLLYILTSITWINIYSFALSLIITCLTAVILNLKEIKKSCSLSVTASKYIMDLLISILIFLLLSIINNVIASNSENLKTIFMIIISFGFFFSTIYLKDRL